MPQIAQKEVGIEDVIGHIEEKRFIILLEIIINQDYKFCINGAICLAKPVINGFPRKMDVYFGKRIQRFFWDRENKTWRKTNS